jgi:hypothetical protein
MSSAISLIVTPLLYLAARPGTALAAAGHSALPSLPWLPDIVTSERNAAAAGLWWLGAITVSQPVSRPEVSLAFLLIHKETGRLLSSLDFSILNRGAVTTLPVLLLILFDAGLLALALLGSRAYLADGFGTR